jgi:hypothetical protein
MGVLWVFLHWTSFLANTTHSMQMCTLHLQDIILYFLIHSGTVFVRAMCWCLAPYKGSHPCHKRATYLGYYHNMRRADFSEYPNLDLFYLTTYPWYKCY